MNNLVVETGIKCFQDEAKALLDVIPRIGEDFEKAVDLIYNCKGKFIVTGVGKSGHVGEKIAATMASLGTPSFFVNPLDAYHGDLGMFEPTDVVLAISYSGNTDELLRFIPMLIDRKIPIIGMSGNPNSLLAQHSVCHLNIAVEREADPLNLAPTSSTTAQMAMGDALACALVKVRNFKDTDFARFHPGGTLGKRLLTKVKDVMHKDNLPVLNEEMSLPDALVRISDGKLGMAAVLDGRMVKGLVTDGDVRRAFQEYGAESFTLSVAQIMNHNPKVINDNDMLSVAESYFGNNKIHTLVVVNESGEFIGFLDSHDCML